MSTPPASHASTTNRKPVLKRIARLLLFVGGLALTGWLIWSTGTANVMTALRGAGPWLPLVILLEIGIVITDYLASRVLVADVARKVTPAAWLRATALAYASSVVLPTQRAAGEAIRAAILSPAIGIGRATRACSRLQGCVLLGNAGLCVVIFAVLTLRHSSAALAIAILGNAVLCAVLGLVILVAARSKRLAQWLGARFKSFTQNQALEPVPGSGVPVTVATLLCLGGRGIEAAQYGVVLHAVGAKANVAAALTAVGIHILGASAGAAVPGQMGATEGAYRLFTDALGLGDSPARALSIALVVRLAQFALAGASFLVALVAARQPRERSSDEAP